jgi:hypothetical protein
MRHLEEIDARQARSDERRIDVFLDVAHQEEPAWPDLAEQDDRHVVDAGPAVGWVEWDASADRPQDA